MTTKLPYQLLADGTDGQLITWDAAGVIATVATGNAGQVLTSNGAGAAPTMQSTGAGDMLLGTTQQVTAEKNYDSDTLKLNGATSGSITVNATAIAGTGTITMPVATDTLVGKATTDTFTNKTFDANATGNSLSNVDVADLADGTDGQLITWDAAGAPATIDVGTATHILTSNGAGAAPTFQAAGDGGSLVLLSTATASASSSIDFTSNIDSTYDEYLITISSLIPASASTLLYMRTDANAGVSFDSGSTDYKYFTTVGDSSSSVPLGDSSTGAPQIVLTSSLVGTDVGEGLSAYIILSNPSNSSQFTLINTSVFYVAGVDLVTHQNGSAMRVSVAIVNAVQFFMSSDNIASGEFKLYGLVKS